MDILNLFLRRKPIKQTLVGGSLLLLVNVTPSLAADDAVNAEAGDVARAIGQLDQSYLYRGLRTGHNSARVEGSSFGDSEDSPASGTRQKNSRVKAVPDQVDQAEVVRNATMLESQDVAEALGKLDQSYALSGQRSGHGTARIEGSSFGDAVD